MNRDGGVPSALFYIDQFVNGEFFSRSEPFTDKDTCIEYLQFLISNIEQNDELYYKISVSMDLNDYQHLILKSNKIRIKFLNNETQTDIEKNSVENTDSDFLLNEENLESNTENHKVDQTSQKIVAVRKRNGYNIKNSKRNRRLLKQYNLKALCKYNEEKNIWKLRDSAIESIH